jgi:hypothetical protein
MTDGAHPLKGRKQLAEHIAKRVATLRVAGVYDRLIARTIYRF